MGKRIEMTNESYRIFLERGIGKTLKTIKFGPPQDDDIYIEYKRNLINKFRDI
jgi:hypothetical protein